MSYSYKYGDQILDAFKIHKKPMNLSEILNYIAIAMKKSKDEINEPVKETLEAALNLGLLVLDKGNYNLPDSDDEDEDAKDHVEDHDEDEVEDEVEDKKEDELTEELK